MIRVSQIVFLCALALAVSCMTRACPAADAAGEKQGEWKVLFDGTDFSSWQSAGGGAPSDGWVIEDKAMVRKPRAGYIWSKERFGDFVLDLEFKTEGNSGVFFRTDKMNDPVQTGFEMQIERQGRPDHKGSLGAIYNCLAPSKETGKPGEWNHVVLTAIDNKITVEINGEQIIDMDVNQWTEPHKNPDGSRNKFRTAIKDFKREGHIGFQEHGANVAYRNVKIKVLD